MINHDLDIYLNEIKVVQVKEKKNWATTPLGQVKKNERSFSRKFLHNFVNFNFLLVVFDFVVSWTKTK